MSVRVEILPEERLHIALYSDHVLPDNVELHWQTLAATPAYEPDFDEMVIYAQGADLSAFSFEFAKSEARRFLDAHDAWPMRCCLVCPDPSHLPMARLYIAYIRTHEPENVALSQFGDVCGATGWINSERTARGAKAVGELAIKQALSVLGAEDAWLAPPDLSPAAAR